MTTEHPTKTHHTACILCSVNCGLEVETEGRRITKVRGDDAHPVSRGYLCEKAQRLDHYQNGSDRLTSPMRRRPDGSYEPVDWGTAIREVARGLRGVKDRHGGESILYFGGGGQGNHLCGAYGDALLKALGVRYRSNALAQEKTGEFWVQGKMFGVGCHGDFEHAEVAVFVGKNPWHSHGIARARKVLQDLHKDPNRTLIVIDPRRSETAALADIHLAVRPGTDAWCLAALAGILEEEGLVARRFIAEHTTGYDELALTLRRIPIAKFAAICGVDEALLRTAARRIAAAKSVSMMEDLGVQMNVHSTLSSYLQRLVWVLTGHFGREGTSNPVVPFLSLSSASKGETAPRLGKKRRRKEPRTPVTGAKIMVGLVPCNVIPEEIVTDHPARFRAMIVESGNPVHSLADSPRMREAFRRLEFSVVIDVAMTETAREAHWVLPASSQFEKAEATFFNLEFPENAFHLRPPLFAPLEGTLPEAEIHARLVEELGVVGERDYRPLRAALRLGRWAFTAAFLAAIAASPRLMGVAPVLAYRTLGRALPRGMEQAAVVWALAQLYALGHREAAARAGFRGIPPVVANALFDALLAGPSGVVFARSRHEDAWAAIPRPEHRIALYLPELVPLLEGLSLDGPPRDAEYPFVLAAGERRSDTTNTAVRDTAWVRKGRYGTLRMHPLDATELGVVDGEQVRLRTRRGTAEVEVELTDTMRRGSLSLPNGQGLEVGAGQVRRGVAPNELTDGRARDPIAGTPWHKYVPAAVERLASGVR
ncbi:MAG: molybdopterin-dependent oxidoreductase [Deltaproteobacteria bacterium]|nr:molybdopterin-dependent oxidoreductase [Deltaproteobacteria bacterium]